MSEIICDLYNLPDAFIIVNGYNFHDGALLIFLSAGHSEKGIDNIENILTILVKSLKNL